MCVTPTDRSDASVKVKSPPTLLSPHPGQYDVDDGEEHQVLQRVPLCFTGMCQTSQSGEEIRQLCRQNSDRRRRQLRPSQSGGNRLGPVEGLNTSDVHRSTGVFSGWRQEEAGEGENHAERLSGV